MHFEFKAQRHALCFWFLFTFGINRYILCFAGLILRWAIFPPPEPNTDQVSEPECSNFPASQHERWDEISFRPHRSPALVRLELADAGVPGRRGALRPVRHRTKPLEPMAGGGACGWILRAEKNYTANVFDTILLLSNDCSDFYDRWFGIAVNS